MSRPRIRIAAAVTLAALAGAAVGAAADSKLRVLVRQSKVGARALLQVSATTMRPETLRVRVYAEPRQRIYGMYELTCLTALALKRQRGGFAGRAPVTRALEMPRGEPERCYVKAQARLAASGRITVLLLKTP